MAPRGSAAARRKQMGEELLESAMANQHRDVVRLLEERADIESQDRAGYTAISEASSAGHAIVVGQLLRALADPDRPAQDGRTALHRATFQNWLPVMRLLLENGASMDMKDEDGVTPLGLVRSGAAKELLVNFDVTQNREAAEDRRKKRAMLPPPPEDEDEEEEAEAPAAVPEEAKFDPPPRGIAEKEEAEAKAKAEKAAARAERERKYQEAMAEIRAQTAQEIENGEIPLANIPPPLIARVEIRGAGESRLNGAYHASFASKDRVEFSKEDDDTCQIYWSEWHDEWRMLVGDYKLGSTLYRHRYRPNIKADECLGVPKEGWQEWFGKAPAPTIRFLPAKGSPEAEAEAAEAKAREEAAAAAAGEQSATQGTTAGKPESGVEKKSEYMEIKNPLDIVAKDVSLERSGTAGSGRKIEVSLHGGERLVETADGLFSPGEVDETEGSAEPAVVDPAQLAAVWLEQLGDAPEVPATWDAVQAAKKAAQDLFSEGKVGDARQATTAAIQAARRLLHSVEDPGPDDEIPIGSHMAAAAEVEKLVGTLYSNRSLLLLQQIQANDAEALKFGAEAAWNLVAKDADEALKVDANNFKASFRRARAFFELGELESALADANRVVDHYAKNSSTPNPEAAALRERILEAIQKERRKWGQKSNARWNRGTHEPLITEIGALGGKLEPETTSADRQRQAATTAPVAQRVIATPARGVPPPRLGGDVEKALLITLKGDASKRLTYVKEHLTADAIRRLFRRTPLGPDLLGVLVRTLGEIATDDKALAEQLLLALADSPSAKTQAAMFDAEERSCLENLVAAVGGRAAAAWSSADDGQAE